jgi:hypothetical protein
MPFGLGENNNSNKSTTNEKKPAMKGIRLPARRKSSSSDILQSLRKLSFLRVSLDEQNPDVVVALNVESRDISKNPYLFSILHFKSDAIDVLYSQIPNTSLKTRKIDIIKYCLNILTLTTGDYEVDTKYLYQLLESVVSDMNEYFSNDYQTLFSKYDSLRADYDSLLKRISSLEESNRKLTTDNYALKNRSEELEVKISQMQKYSDSVLAIKIQDWIDEHNGEINLSEFSHVYKVSEARIEQILNNLISEGYLENKK